MDKPILFDYILLEHDDGIVLIRASMTHKRVFQFLIFILFGVALGLLVAEAGLHLFTPQWLKQKMKYTNLGGALRYGTDAGWPVESIQGKFVRFTPGSHFQVQYYEYNNGVNIDRWGARATDDRKDGGPFLPFLGDSFTFGLGVEDRQTYVSLLNEKIRTLRLLNLGIPGSSLPQQLDVIAFRHKEIGSPSGYVFSFYLGNDFVDILRYYSLMNATEQANESPGNRSEWKRILDRLSGNSIFAKSYLAQYVSGIRDQTDVDQRRFRHAWVYRGHPVNYKFLLINDQVRYKDEIRRFLDLSLKKLVELSQELHFRCLFIIIPDKHQLNPSFIKSQAASYGVSLSEIDPQYPDRFLQQELQIYGIPSIDLFPCLENRTGLYYLHDDHFTEAGHRVAAQCVLKPLQDWVANEIVK